MSSPTPPMRRRPDARHRPRHLRREGAAARRRARARHGAARRSRSSRPQPGWSEQDPQDWWTAACDCLDALPPSTPKALRAVRAIGLSGQMHGATLLDGDGRVLRPCILWNDGRSAPQCAQLEAARAGAARDHRQRSRCPDSPRPSCCGCAQHEPEVFARIAARAAAQGLAALAALRRGDRGDVRRVGHACGSTSRAARWSGRRCWPPAGSTRSQMPRLVEGTMPAGELRSRAGCSAGASSTRRSSPAARATTRPARWRWARSRPGDAFVSLGTSGVLWATTARLRAGAGARRCTPSATRCRRPGTRWACCSSAAASLAWWAA